MARPKSTSKLIPLRQIYPQDVCNGLDALTSMHLIPEPTTAGELGIVEEISDAWAIAAFWIAHDMMPVVDTGRPPFVYANFQQYRSWAKVLYAHQRLCIGTKEYGQSSQFSTPFSRWLACMGKIKLGHFLQALSPPGLFFPGIVPPPSGRNKSDFILKKEYFLADITEGRIPSEVANCPTSHTVRLYRDANYLIKSRNPKH